MTNKTEGSPVSPLKNGSGGGAVGEPNDVDAPLFPFQRLDAYVVAKELAGRVQHAKIRDTELRDQATRAAKSTFLGLCEGLPNDSPAMRRKYSSSRTTACTRRWGRWISHTPSQW